ncbi:MAG: methyltransferase domain-containing protein [Alphaproteobacteria bacterium]
MATQDNVGSATTSLKNHLSRCIETYYREVRIDYQIVWQNKNNLAFHFGYYDRHSLRSHSAALQRTNDVLANLAAIAAGHRVLDAGCGFGGSGFWLAEKRGAAVVGIANVEDSIRRARAIARQRRGADAVCFLTADYLNMPFPDGCFDVVWALESLCHADDKPRFYGEANRVLRPGGRLVVAEYMRRTRDIGASEAAIVSEWLRGWAIPDLDTGEEHYAAAERAGFSGIVLSDATRHTRRSLAKLHRRAIAAYPVNWSLRRLGLRTEAQYWNVIASRRQYQALRYDSWFYGILSATKPKSRGQV